MILIRDHEYVCEDQGARRVRQDPAAPVTLAGALRAMGLMEPQDRPMALTITDHLTVVRMPRTLPGSATAEGS